MRLCVAFLTTLALASCGASNSKPRLDEERSWPTTWKPSSATKDVAIAPGATQLTYKGTLGANKDAEFIIGEEQGSVFMAHALTPKHDLDIAVYRADTGARITDE